MIDINKMTMNELIVFFREGNSDDILEIISNKEYILNLEPYKLNLLFLNINDEYKKVLLSDFAIFDKVMNIPLNRMKKSVIDLVSDDIRYYIYNSENLIKSMAGKKILKMYLKKLSNEKLNNILNNNNLEKVYQFDVMEYANSKFMIDDYLKSLISNSINNKNFSSLALFNIKNEADLLIYVKFNILVSTTINDKQVLINDAILDYNFLKKVNRKHILSLLELLKTKNKEVNNNMLFVGVIKLYMIYGLDNSKKIINDFFTYATSASLKRVSYELFKENRREFRLKNQKKFYYNNMELDFLKALENNDLSFFKNFCLNTSDEWITNFIISISTEIKELKVRDKVRKIKEIIDKEIRKREDYYRKLDTSKYYKYYQETSRIEKISYLDIYNIFKNVDISYCLTKDGKIIVDDELNKFLLGNYKKDNDCLLRMVLNKHAFGLNSELYNIINNFHKIQQVVSKNKELSLNSISDIIDISKVFLYKLKPNELDITLETLSKILNSRKYCIEESSIILERAMNLHIRRKRKIGCAINYIKGEYNDIKYRLVDFDSEDLLVSGIDSDSCFKIGGQGEELFEYCLVDSRGAVFYLDYNNTRYILPSTINGNMLNINSIDPVIKDELEFTEIITAITKMAKEIVNDFDNKIELVTVTDVHLNHLFDSSKYEAVFFSEYIPFNTCMYCDYNKKNVTNYVIYKKDENTVPKYFNNLDLFYQIRSAPYIILPHYEYDSERMNIRINSIAYSSIDYLNITEEEKVREKYYYTNKDIADYIYIVGNKDWYIGIKKDNSLDKYLLPYDNRAIKEYNKYLYSIESNLLEEQQKRGRKK